jgi:hypothetical protein
MQVEVVAQRGSFKTGCKTDTEFEFVLVDPRAVLLAAEAVAVRRERLVILAKRDRTLGERIVGTDLLRPLSGSTVRHVVVFCNAPPASSRPKSWSAPVLSAAVSSGPT